MDFETVDAGEFGKSLTGIGINILVRDVMAQAKMLTDVFDMTAHRLSKDFAIMAYGNQIFQLHSDATYHSNPLLALLPESGFRGAGLEIRLYDSDPFVAVQKASLFGLHILQEPAEKPHGLIEAYIICENGYAWVPSRHSQK